MASADEVISYDSVPGYVRHVRLLHNDEVTDNCWTNARNVLARTRLLLENNDVHVFVHDPAFQRLFSPFLQISAVGYRSGGLCVGSASVEMFSFGSATYGGADGKPEYRFRVQQVIFDKTSVFSSGTNFNQQIDDFVNGSISEFLADAVAARRDPKVKIFFETYPGFGEVPMTREEWDEYLSNTLSQQD